MPELLAAMLVLLARVQQLMQARRSPVDLVLFTEVYHAVLSHLDSFEDQLWDLGDDEQAQQRVQQVSRALQGRSEILSGLN